MFLPRGISGFFVAGGPRPAGHFKVLNYQCTRALVSSRAADSGKGELTVDITRIQKRPRKATRLALIQDGKDQRLTYFALRSRFDKAFDTASVRFQFRDIRAKSATDTEDLQYAQKVLGHKHPTMTQHCTLNRKGEKIRPLR